MAPPDLVRFQSEAVTAHVNARVEAASGSSVTVTVGAGPDIRAPSACLNSSGRRNGFGDDLSLQV